jgi:hypothetical protein
MLNPNLEKKLEKCLTLTPWHGTEKSVFALISDFFFLIDIRSCCIPLERAQKVTSTGEKIIKNGWPVQKLWNFLTPKSGKKVFQLFLHILEFLV